MKAAMEKLATAKKTLQYAIDAIIAANVSEYDELVNTDKNLQVMLDDVKKEAFDTNKKEIDYKRLARKTTSGSLSRPQAHERDGPLCHAQSYNNVRILDAAQVIKMPIKPRVRTNLPELAALLGLVLGVGLAFLIEFQDRTIKGHLDIEAMGLNFLGLIPSIPAAMPLTRRSATSTFSTNRRAPRSRNAAVTIRTNLLFMSPDNPAKRLVVTSAGPQEGKTTTLINLESCLPSGTEEIFLVDSDMRRPRLHKSFGVANEVGLSSLIVGEGSIEDAIKTTSVPGLFVLPSGPVPPNAAVPLHTERFRKLAEQLGERFDRVLFDSPPVGAVTDPLVLANQLDGTILVTKMLRTDRDLAERSAKSIRDANGKILGAILNDVDIEKRQYGYYLGYYYSYGRYYGEKKGAA